MSLRRKLLAMKADWEKWENRISIAVAVFFAGAVIANAGLFFSVRKTPSFFGAAFSWLYVTSWFLAAILLRDRERAAGIEARAEALAALCADRAGETARRVKTQLTGGNGHG